MFSVPRSLQPCLQALLLGGIFTLCLNVCATVQANQQALPANVIVVCPTSFQEAIQPLVQRRQAEGLRVQVIPSQASSADLAKSIQAVADLDTTRYVILVGDCSLRDATTGSDPKYEVPTLQEPATVTAAWKTTPMLPGDTFYGDFDNDGFPDAAVGRIPIDSARQLTTYIDRIIHYEDESEFGPWWQRVQLTAGVGGFGFLADTAIESVTRGMVTSSMPAWTHTQVTYASPTSPFNPGLNRFQEAVLKQYSQGNRFWVYAGHGWVTELDRVPATAAGRPVLANHNVDGLQLTNSPPPIALMFACYTGAFDANEDCLAEQMLRTPHGPIAVVAGSRVTLPYGNAVVATGLIRAVYEDHAPRLGDAWRTALREVATASEANPELKKRRTMIDTLATLISPTAANLPAERREHMQLYNLLGDPTLRLLQPQKLPLNVAGNVPAGNPITITGTSPIDGTLTLSLHRAIGSLPAGTPLEDRHQLANSTEVARDQVIVKAKQPFSMQLPTLATLTGTLHVIGAVKESSAFAIGDVRVLITSE
ncbi:Gingipain R2 precursor [Roseimaritima multifibrata]|uniref:Gingipain R2 n=1 Tax=Roseimaritima multifibrata TaxID=1930274 RepID=A0A517MP67_9BACT|nr:C25 family cysteine peptidase [Roseimaritima multifibrata]QDS96675.1 Gingipain R2 precursor [Roseimaritima multifibrata]